MSRDTIPPKRPTRGPIRHGTQSGRRHSSRLAIDEGLSPEKRRELIGLQSMLGHLAHASQALATSGEDHPMVVNRLREFHTGLMEHLQSHPSLTLDLGPAHIDVDGVRVYHDRDVDRAMTFELYRAGVRKIVLSVGVDRRSVLTLARLVTRHGGGHHEDPSIEVWAARAPGLAVEFVDPFTTDGLLPRGAPLWQRFRDVHAEHTTELVTVTGLEPDPADPLLEHLSRDGLVPLEAPLGLLFGGNLRGSLPGPDEGSRGWLTGTVRDDDERTWRHFVATIPALVTRTGHPRMAPLVVRHVLTRAKGHIDAKAWEAHMADLARVKAALVDAEVPPLYDRIIAAFASEKAILALRPSIEGLGDDTIIWALKFLALLPEEAAPHLVALLVTLADGKLARALARLLGQRGVDLTDYHVALLGSSTPSRALEGVTRLDAKGTSKALYALYANIGHPLPEVRAEILVRLAKRSYDEPVSDAAIQAFRDDDPRLHKVGMTLVLAHHDLRAVPMVASFVHDKRFAELPDDVKLPLVALLSAADDPTATASLEKLLVRPGLLKWRRKDDLQRIVVLGILDAPSPGTRAMLLRAIDTKGFPNHLADQVRRRIAAMDRAEEDDA